jgi:predicted amidohydrolase
VLLCADLRGPESARVERLKGARITLIPSYDRWHLGNEWWMRTRSHEAGNVIAFVHPHVAFVWDPGARIAAKLQTNITGTLICDVDLSPLRNSHIDDRRPELYRDCAAEVMIMWVDSEAVAISGYNARFAAARGGVTL